MIAKRRLGNHRQRDLKGGHSGFQKAFKRVSGIEGGVHRHFRRFQRIVQGRQGSQMNLTGDLGKF